MMHRLPKALSMLATLVALLLFMQTPVSAQQRPGGAKNKTVATTSVAVKKPATTASADPRSPRTPWGDPDLQGVYTFSTLTPLERPKGIQGKDTYTEAELAELEEQLTANITAEGRAPSSGDPGTYNNFWTSTEKGRLTGRTALITDPDDGRKPPLTKRGQELRDQLVKEATDRRVKIGSVQHTLYDSWTDHPTYTRCLARPMPRIGQSYNHGLEILQTPGTVVIHYESLHDVRIIPLDNSPHLDSRIRQWNGDSRGHWEGNTLVIDWTNFTDQQDFQGQPQGNMHLIERLTRLDANTVQYEVTVADPMTWTAPWKFSTLWRGDDPVYRNAEDLYEYACHEGNYRMMEDSLLGTRAVERTAEQPESGTKK